MLDASIYLFYGAEQNSWCADKDGNKDIGSYKPSKRDGHGRSTGDPKTKSHRTRICRRKPMPLDESYLLRMTSVFQ
ncbi:hypothetical protein SCLCIDRAFT_206933 [Scleroderma citrinum Foug A]|uniref:Uncharacterized protein n=1 Tax=Scleroderma citrinum Foug A TaxID=1036808 RepID=A0A0C3D7S6_9AGAM|nr:hypothetical protein SCLCIDRAFT_206933 [Scleroderma citrinum Foug A]